MIALARIFEAWRDAEDFKTSPEDKSFLWHLFKLPQFGLMIFSFYVYFQITQGWLAFVILAADILLAWVTFEFFLDFFRKKLRK